MFNSIKKTEGSAEDIRGEKMAEMKKTQQMFFKLLTAQLKCQDLDNTVDMNQMTQNIYQMNELQTLMSIDYKLDGIATGLNKSGSLPTASNMIGKFALTRGDSIAIDAQSSEIPISYIVDSHSQNVSATIKIMDPSGNLVHQAQLENIKGNAMQNFILQVKDQNGKLNIPEGVYKVQFLATNQDKKPVAAEMFTANKIQQAMMDGKFIMSNGQKIAEADIFAIQESPLAIELDYNPFAKGKLKQSVAELMRLRSNTTKV